MLNLQKNDIIGIISPSAPISAFCPRRLGRGVAMLERSGYKVKVGSAVSAVDDFTAGTIAQRVSDIHSMFSDPEVKCIMCTIGGYNANELLDHLDYDLIKKNKKLVIGYSDSCALLSAILVKSDVPVIMGPMLLPQFGEYPEIIPFTLKSFEHVTSNIGSGSEYVLPVSESFTEEFLSWDQDDNRPRRMENNPGLRVISPGESEGILLAGNVSTLNKLIGTDYLFNFSEAILFLEDDDGESPATLQRMLVQFKQAGLLSKIRGIVFGRYQAKSKITDEILSKILATVFGKISFPVITGADFGHTDPMVSLPLNHKVYLTASESPKIVIVL